MKYTIDNIITFVAPAITDDYHNKDNPTIKAFRNWLCSIPVKIITEVDMITDLATMFLEREGTT